MRNSDDTFERLIRNATGREGIAALLRALGIEPRMTSVPPAAHGTFGLSDDEGVDALVVAGGRRG